MKRTTLAAVLTKNVTTLSTDITVSNAMEIMSLGNLSSLIIVDADNRPIGIFTERDSLKVISGKIGLESLLGDVMTRGVYTVHVDAEIHDTYAVMSEKGFRHLVIVDEEGKLAGVATQGDFLRHIGFDNMTYIKNITTVMTKSIVMLEREATITYAAEQMAEHYSDYAVIAEGMIPIGLITERDILQYASSKHECSGDPIWHIYQRDFPVCTEETSLAEAASLMERHGIHQLIIVDENGNLVGLLTRYDLLQALHGSYFEFLIRQIDTKSAALTELKDVYTKLIQDQDDLSKSEEKFRTLFNMLPDGIVLVDPITHQTVDFNSIAAQQLGYTSEEFLQVKISDYETIETKEETESHIKAVLSEGRHEFDTVHRQKNGSLMDIRVIVSAVTIRDHPYLLAYYRDITEQKRYEEKLETLANYDSLTGLANRALLSSHLQRSIEKAKRLKTQIAVLMFDLDRFKDVNDSFGHGAGDELLQQVAQRFAVRLREGDIISRLGGDEFAIVLEQLARPEDAGRIAIEMINAQRSPYKLISGAAVHIGMSAGIVIFPDHGESASELLQHADAALYKAKGEGRGIYRYYTDELTDSARRRIECETQLRRAVDNNEFEVYYQPQVHIATGQIVGAEALVRWNDPERGMIFPSVFIPIAEDTGLIGAIGEWVLNETCRQGKIWLDSGHRLTLAVNLSAHQVRHQDIPAMVDAALKQSGYPADKLELELTESALMQREEETVTMLHMLRAQGIRLAIDDFGTGYSSLSYLKRFPIDVLKIDKSFVDDLPFDADDMAIVTAIIAMGKALGFQILAEGTERIEQIEFLKERGCTMYQGYFKSPPLPAQEFVKLLYK
ncbi:MAG: EAL domain-containing protein [Sulfuricurvum sp.]|nr:EAL domain-containing protein [Sulfuricurvum sp.]